MTLPRPAASLSVLALLLALSGCSQSESFPPVCPQLSLLADGADLTRFAGAGRDVTDRVLDARIVAVDASCRAGRRGEVLAVLRVQVALARGPAARGRDVVVPYLVAVTEGEAVLDRREFALSATFPTNVDTIAVTGEELELRFPAGQAVAAQKIYVSLRLTEAELAWNRRAQGGRVP